MASLRRAVDERRRPALQRRVRQAPCAAGRGSRRAPCAANRPRRGRAAASSWAASTASAPPKCSASWRMLASPSASGLAKAPASSVRTVDGVDDAGRRGGVEPRRQRLGAARRTRRAHVGDEGGEQRRAARRGPRSAARSGAAGSASDRARRDRRVAGRATRPPRASARSSTPVTSRKRRLRASPVRSTSTQPLRVGGPPVEVARRPGAEPVDDRRVGGGERRQAGHLERHRHGVGGRRSAAQHDAVADNGDVPLSVAVIVDGTDRRVGDAQSGDAPTEQRWRHQRGDEDDDQQGGVLVVAEDALGEADRGEDDPDLAAWDHADADEQPIDSAGRRCRRPTPACRARRRRAAPRPDRAPPAWPSRRGRRRGRSARRTPGSARWRRRRTRARRERGDRCARSPGRRRRRR